MNKISYGQQIDAARPWSFPAPAMTALVTLAYIYWKGIPVSTLMTAVSVAACAALLVLGPLFTKNILGQLGTLLLFGLLPALGTSYLACGEIVWGVLLAAVPSILLTDAALRARNIRDREADRENGRKTSASLFGHKTSAWIYWGEVIGSYIWLGILSMFYLLPVYTVFVFLTIPVAIGCARGMVKSVTAGNTIIEDMDIRTKNIQLMFSAILMVTLVIDGMVK